MVKCVLHVPCTSYGALAPLNLGEGFSEDVFTTSQAINTPAEEEVCGSVKSESKRTIGQQRTKGREDQDVREQHT